MLKTDESYLNVLKEKYGNKLLIDLKLYEINNTFVKEVQVTTIMCFLDRCGYSYKIVDDKPYLIEYEL